MLITVRALEKAKFTGNFAAMSSATHLAMMKDNSQGDGSESESDASDPSNNLKRKKLKT